MTRQETNWGYIDWLEEDMDESKSALNVGIVTIAPHAHMTPHIHFTEQVIYTLQGTGYSLVDGEKIDMSRQSSLRSPVRGTTLSENSDTAESKTKRRLITL